MHVFISVGEPSGDLHGSNLIRAIRRHVPEVRFSGVAGPKMVDAGCHSLDDLSSHAIMGFLRVVPFLGQLWRLLGDIDRHLQQTRPDAVVLIDFPGFNWWVARTARKHGIPVFYYGTPQIWGWATHRVRKLRRLVDHALCKLPFEPEWYRQRGCQATYVGHPYFDELEQHTLDRQFIDGLGTAPLVTLLPGSRRGEVQQNLPAFLRVIDEVHRRCPDAQFALASFNDAQAELARQLIAEHHATTDETATPLEVHVGRTRELMHQAYCCVACSGSVSLELLHECKPTVIHYKIDWIQDRLQRAFRRCKFITLVNLLASSARFDYRSSYDPDDLRQLDEAPFPEYLTTQDRSAAMARHVCRWLQSPQQHAAAVEQLRQLGEGFVQPGASRRAAIYILRQLGADVSELDAAPAETSAETPAASTDATAATAELRDATAKPPTTPHAQVRSRSAARRLS